jgi:RimJ/RimL family protein N-acetyltransferase
MDQHDHHHEPLPPPTAEATGTHLASIAEALGDSPETVIPLQFLRDGRCEVLVVGDPGELEGVIIQSTEMPEEPIAFGSSAEAVASLIPHLEGWACLNVPIALADDLVEAVAAAAGTDGVRMLDDVYHELRTPVPPSEREDVRLLTDADAALIESAPPGMAEDGGARLRETIARGHVAGAIRDGALVSIAHTFAISDRHADIGVVTHPDWRGQGLGTAVAAEVAKAIQDGGRTPVWSCGGTNLASLRIAARLGFVEVSRRIYLIPDFGEDEAVQAP